MSGITLQVKKGETKALPGANGAYTIGVGWDPAGGVGDSPDLDIWVVRNKGGVGEPICWANNAWHRADLGSNSEGNPYIATPELDVIHQGDDRTGAQSDGDYDEIVKLDLSKAPADVTKYDVFVTYYVDPGDATKTLGMAENIKCGVTDDTTGNTLETALGNDFGFDVTAHICTIAKDPATGKWTETATQVGYQESMFEVVKQFDYAG